MLFLDVLTILCAGLMIGNELAVSLFVNPVMWKLEDRSQAKALSLFAGTLGKVMPFWYALCLVLMIAETYLRRHQPGLTLLLMAVAIWIGDHRLYRHHPCAHQQSHRPSRRCFARGMAGRA